MTEAGNIEYKPTRQEDVQGYAILGFLLLIAAIGLYVAAEGGITLYRSLVPKHEQAIIVYMPSPKYDNRIDVTPPVQNYFNK